MINQRIFADKMKEFSALTAQRFSADTIGAFYERFKFSDEQSVIASLEAMIHGDDKLTFAKLKEKVKLRVLAGKEKVNNQEINIETWKPEQQARMNAIAEAIQKGPGSIQSLNDAQRDGQGIWDFKNDQIGAKYDCHENCDNGTVFYQGKNGDSYAGTCAICKRGPGKPSNLINPDNMQIIKWGVQRQGG